MKPTTQKTYDQILSLFEKFTYQYDFNREDIEQIFKVKKSRASEIIALLLEKQLITSSAPTRYKFKK